jgi:hypothetical protein
MRAKTTASPRREEYQKELCPNAAIPFRATTGRDWYLTQQECVGYRHSSDSADVDVTLSLRGSDQMILVG